MNAQIDTTEHAAAGTPARSTRALRRLALVGAITVVAAGCGAVGRVKIGRAHV